MYIPSAFRVDDIHALHNAIDNSRLATVISQGAEELQASQLPLLLVPDEGFNGTLYGHFARANGHWRELAENPSALVLFTPADAYVSPSWYPAKAAHGKVVPTWNYISVEVRGKVEVFEDKERLLQLVSRLSQRHEAGRPQPWAVSDAPADYIDSMLRAIVGFALPIERIEGKFKLSQNRDMPDRIGVSTGLNQSADPRDVELAGHLGQTLSTKP
ncbi:transcriptional regulator [Pseudomonas sp. J237]|nr:MULTISPECIES: FMN-binding negative transcriptional regulator [Pseudomonas]OEO26342.1 transcriptional regulator [Pseudomonas sp. J237]